MILIFLIACIGMLLSQLIDVWGKRCTCKCCKDDEDDEDDWANHIYDDDDD